MLQQIWKSIPSGVITLALVSFLGAFTLAQEKIETGEKECSKSCCSGHESHGSMSMAYMNTDSTYGEHHKMKSDDKMHGMHKDMKSDDKMHGMHKDMKSDGKMHGMQHDTKSESMDETSIVREGEIDLASIDKNDDGKIYQDQMCWNVISDEAGECPLCGMTLKEVSLEKAKENLLEHDHKVK